VEFTRNFLHAGVVEVVDGVKFWRILVVITVLIKVNLIINALLSIRQELRGIIETDVPHMLFLLRYLLKPWILRVRNMKIVRIKRRNILILPICHPIYHLFLRLRVCLCILDIIRLFWLSLHSAIPRI
jgi:hypothetical protein